MKLFKVGIKRFLPSVGMTGIVVDMRGGGRASEARPASSLYTHCHSDRREESFYLKTYFLIIQL